MGVFDYCAAGHWDEEAEHDCTFEDGVVEQLKTFGWVMMSNYEYEIFDGIMMQEIAFSTESVRLPFYMQDVESVYFDYFDKEVK